MPDVKWTTEQAQAIEAQGGSVLVSAAAGSGKTAVLVERVIRLMTREESPVPADRLLIVTFTKAAAAEMKQRIAAALSQRISAEPSNLFLLEQQILLSRASICTIDAFCSELLRENFETLDIAPDYRIADQTEVELIKHTVIDRVLEGCHDDGEEGFLRLTDFFAARTEQLLIDQVFLVYEFIRSHPFPLEWLAQQEKNYKAALETGQYPWRAIVADELLETLKYAEQQTVLGLSQMNGDEALSASYRQAFENDFDFMRSLQERLTADRWDDAVLLAEEHKFPSLKPLKNYDDLVKKDWFTELRDDIKKELNGAKELLLRCSTNEETKNDLEKTLPVMLSLFDVVRRLYTAVDEEKRRKNVLDFSDLELLALRLLAKPREGGFEKTPLAAAYEVRFEEILVDEYQDINEVQDTIFRALSRGETNLFMVGDVKQSIYRFRKAMPELFLRRSEEYNTYDGERYPAKIRLDANFRSRRGVTNAVNFLFSALMSPELGDVNYANEALKPAAVFPLQETTEPAVELQIIDHLEAVEQDEERITYEARQVAYEIRRMVAQGMTVTDRGEERRCRYGDFCIMLRSMKEKAELFEQEFYRQGVPLWSDVSSGYFDSEEVSAMLSLLKVLDNPLQDVPLLAVLLSPIYGFTPDETAEIRLMDKKTPLYVALKAYAENGSEKASRFLESVEKLRAFSAVSRLDELIQMIYDTTGFMAFAGASALGEQRTANLRLLLEYAHRYEETGRRGVSGFVRYIDQAVERGQDFSPANVVNEKANVVRLMSIHHSKGLEFPVCFVADLGKRFNEQDLRGDILLHPVQGIGMKVREPETLKRYATLPYEALRLSVERDLYAEELRVLYVALTRAKEKLVLVLSCKDFSGYVNSVRKKLTGAGAPEPYALRNMKSFGEWITAALLTASEVYEALEETPSAEAVKCKSGVSVSLYPPVDGESAENLEQYDVSVVDEEIWKRLSQRVSFRYPFEEIARLPGKLTVTQVTKPASTGDVILAKPSFLTKRKFSAAERGTVFHRFMQHVDLNAVGRVKEELVRQIDSAFLSEEEAAVLDAKKIEQFLRSGIAEEMRNAGSRLYREYKFMYEMGVGELYGLEEASGETVLIQGVADAVIADEDGLTIIDYKTDRVDQIEELDERYRAQLELYGRALTKSFGLPVKRNVIYSFSLSRELELEHETI